LFWIICFDVLADGVRSLTVFGSAGCICSI
jgi:hypothetical protein